jgi:type I restriction enzyme S subunit
LFYALKSATAQRDALSRVLGATVRGINIWDLKRVRIPAVDSAEQQVRVSALSELDWLISEIRRRLDRQTDLLSEHRHALITAAVTGQLRIPGAAA